jgi:hypothetical protein
MPSFACDQDGYPSDYTLKRSSFGRTIPEWFAQPERDLVNTLRSRLADTRGLTSQDNRK